MPAQFGMCRNLLWSKRNTVRSTFLDAVPPSPSPGMRAALLLVQSLRRTDGLDRRMSYLSHRVSTFDTRMITCFTVPKKSEIMWNPLLLRFAWYVSVTGVSILHVYLVVLGKNSQEIGRKSSHKSARSAWNQSPSQECGNNKTQPKDIAWRYTQNDPKCDTLWRHSIRWNGSTCLYGVEPTCTFLVDFKGT